MRIHSVYAQLLRPFRRRRMGRFAQQFRDAKRLFVVDVGGSPFNWSFAIERPRVVLVNLRAPGDARTLPEGMRLVIGDGTRLAFADGAFDVAFSNSVIEHLGTPERQAAFAAELRRVARGLWVQTPARAFPVEPHLLAPFVHWLPRRWQRRLLRRFTLWGWLSRPGPERVERFLEETRLLGLREMRALFPDCEIRRERFLGLTKSYVAVRPGAALR
jgi:SAM-dependent methyltransferase